jgi:hypothetical protein
VVRRKKLGYGQKQLSDKQVGRSIREIRKKATELKKILERLAQHKNPNTDGQDALQLFNGIAAEYDNLYGVGTTTTWTDPT